MIQAFPAAGLAQNSKINALSNEPKAIIDWSVLEDILPGQTVKQQLPLPLSIPQSSMNANLLNNDVLKARATDLDQEQKEAATILELQNQLARQPSQSSETLNGDDLHAKKTDEVNEFIPSAPPAMPSDLVSALGAGGTTPPSPPSPSPPPPSPPPMVPELAALSKETAPKEIAAKKTTAPVLPKAIKPPIKEKPALASLTPTVPPKVEKSPASLKAKPNDDLLLRLPYQPMDENLDDKGQSSLQSIITQLQQNPDLRVNLLSYAHDPAAGTIDHNMMKRLALTRARALRRYFNDNDISSKRIYLKPMGDKTLDSTAIQALNPNRVDIIRVK